MTPTQTPARLLAAGCTVAVLAGLTACTTHTGDTAPRPDAVAPGDRTCWPRDQFGNEMPSLNPAYASGLTSDPIELTAGVGTPTDQVEAPQAILDFPQMAITDLNKNMVVLVLTKVFTDEPAGWDLNRSMAIVAFEPAGPDHAPADGAGGLARTGICPLGPAEVAGVLRATGREPLPAHVSAGQTAEGWVAFVVPRTSTVLTLRLQRLDPDGGYAAASYPLFARPAPGAGG